MTSKLPEYVVTDVNPRVVVCPLPSDYRWEIELNQKLNCVMINLHKGRVKAVTCQATGCIIDFIQTPFDEAMKKIIDKSYQVWQEFYQNSLCKKADDEWVRRASDLQDCLPVSRGTKLKVKLKGLA